MARDPGLVALFGSGETSSNGRKVYDWLFRRCADPLTVAILETPAGFELNSPRVAGRIGDFLQEKLQNYRPQIEIVPARKRGTDYSPDDPAILAPLFRSNTAFLGPGSPTYAVRQLEGSLAWESIQALHRLGKLTIFASAATVAASRLTLPVYEIYKAGEDLHWRQGLDFFGPYGLSIVFVPHWNNTEGGAELDTSRCYMGRSRFEQLASMLPPETVIVGIDEHTALIVDLANDQCLVLGLGSVTITRKGEVQSFPSGEAFPLHVLGSYRREPAEAIRPEVWQLIDRARAEVKTKAPVAPPEALELVIAREAARARRDWATADALREQIATLGWQVADAPEGPHLSPKRTRSS